MQFRVLLSLLGATSLAAAACGSTYAYNNFGPGDTFIDGSGYDLPGGVPTFLFTSTASGMLTDISLAVGNLNADQPPFSFTVSLYAYTTTPAGPGTLLGSWDASSDGTDYYLIGPNDVVHIDASTSGLSLVSGVSYWISASSPNSLVWDFCPSAQGVGIVFGTESASINQSAFSVSVNSVPSPSALISFGLGLFGGLVRRKKA